MKNLPVFTIVGCLAAGLTGISPAADSPSPAALEKEIGQLQKKLVAKQKLLATLHGKDPKKQKELAAASGTDRKASAAPAPETAKIPETETKPQTINPLSGIIQTISLRNSLFDENAFQKDAVISYTHPGHGSESYAIDAGLKFDLQPRFSLLGGTVSSSLGIEYHRNSDPRMLKDQLKFGGEFERVFGYAATSPVLLDAVGDFSYKIDNVKNLQSVTGKLKLLPVIRFEKMGLDGMKFLSTDEYHRMWGARWRWQPFVEVQYEGTTQTGSGTASGHHVLVDYGAELRLYPFFSSKLGTKVEVTATYKGWAPIDPTGVFAGESTSSYYEADLTYWFEAPNLLKFGEKTQDKTSIGVSLGYKNGNNLETGDKNVDLLTVALHARF